MSNHDVLGAILLFGSPLWCWAYVRHNVKVLRGGYDKDPKQRVNR